MKNTVLLLFMFSSFCLSAQNYLISFNASGLSNTLDSVYVENMTQGTAITIQGNDTLKLYGTAGFNFDLSQHISGVKLYPNPISEKAVVEFYSEIGVQAVIDIFDVSGKLIIHENCLIQKGMSTFEISGFTSGYYSINISAKGWQRTLNFTSLNDNNSTPKIKFKGGFENEVPYEMLYKNSKNIIQMPFTEGDQLLFVGYSGALNDAVVFVPTSSTVIDFQFELFSCGNTFTDIRDGSQYPSLLIGSQCWMGKNLAYLPWVVTPLETSVMLPHIYVYGYNGTNVNEAKATINYQTYGVLYNWSAIMNNAESTIAIPSGVQGICPAGWHVPSDGEWTQLVSFLGGESVAGAKLKEAGTLHWLSPNNGTNESGFTALPGGGKYSDNAFYGINNYGRWWSATESFNNDAWFRDINNDWSNIWRHEVQKEYGFSVRCVKD